LLSADAPTLVWLDQKPCQDPVLTGGKAANLSRLVERYRIPLGFCVTTAAFQPAAAESGVIGARLREQVHAAYAHLSQRVGHENVAVAVRSSATDEDGQNAAFAGQYETLLNVKGASAVEAAIVQCWRSANSARARTYREARGRSTEDVRVAVLIQHLIPADAAGVIFSANPVAARSGEAIVTAAFGLGESVVGGSVTPDTFMVQRRDGSMPVIVNRQIACKNIMTVLTSDGTDQVPVPEAERACPSVTDDQVLDAAILAWELEAEMGWPVDVECAWHHGVLYLLQCRPITALSSQR
jgi:pyruvate,water dikinase